MRSRLSELGTDPRVLAVVYSAITIAATVQKYFHGGANNLRIFRASFFNLVAGTDLYALHPGQHFDYFKYSPTFALLFAPLSLIPEFISAIAWNLINVFALFAAVYQLHLTRREKGWVLWLILVEVVTSIQNFQSNGIVAALVIATFVMCESDASARAALFATFGAAMKIFGGGAAMFVVFLRRKWTSLVTAVMFGLLLAAAPLLVTSPSKLLWQYQNWFGLLRADYDTPGKLSVMNALQAWFGVMLPKMAVQGAGLCVLLAPLLRRERYADPIFRLQILASFLIFVVLFNHKAESPMFVLAVSGVAIWYVSRPRTPLSNLLITLVILITSFGSTDLVPQHLRETITSRFALKTAPCLLAWIVIETQLLFSDKFSKLDAGMTLSAGVAG